ncbi:MAG: polyprenol monophosphomannose synthase [Thermoanaerobaculia bacterium]|nr:polyprenol monophosphomannose synthase [Thermoanaerobaculia bacterium]
MPSFEVADDEPLELGDALLRPLLVVPTYNEAQNVASLSRRVLAVAPHARILFVDDASPDGTGRTIRELMTSDARVELRSRPRKLGLGSAYREGFDHAFTHGHDVVVTMDADLSHDPSHLPALLDAAADSDLVVGSRYVAGGGIENWGLHRRALSRIANRLARMLLCSSLSDWTSGFRVYRTEMLRSLPLDRIRSSGYSFLEEISYYAVRGGYRVREVPIVFVDRQGGRSKISSREILLAVYHLLRLALVGDRTAPAETRDEAPEASSASSASSIFVGES